MPTTATGAAAVEPGVSEFDSFIHSDLCAGVSGAPEVPPNNFGFMPPFAMSGAMPLGKPAFEQASTTPDELPSLTLEWNGASGSPATPAGTALGPGESCAFNQTQVWAPAASSSPQGGALASFSSMATKPDPDAPPLSLLLKDENAMGTPWVHNAPSDAAVDKRRKLSYPLPQGPPAEVRPRAMTTPDMSKRESPEALTPAQGSTRTRKPQGAARRPPPSASQVTEAGQPFPVIDTSAKHSSLFIPPDTSGLTKREARLVKNRAAAFLSRQRKREQFEELGGKCKVLARLAWILYESLAQISSRSQMYPQGANTMERMLATTPLGEQLKHESDDLRAVFHQLISQQGAMVFDSHYAEGNECCPKGSPPPAESDLRAQLSAAKHEAEAARSECAALRAELARVKEAQAPPLPTTTLPELSQPTALFFLVGIALVRWRTTGSIPPELLHEMQTHAADAPLQELFGDENKGLVHLRVSSRDSEAVLCTLTTEPEDRARSATPEHAHGDGGSDTSVPSLSSASPTLSSLSTSSASTRRTRRVLAFCADAQSKAQPVAYLDAHLLRNLRPVPLDGWAAEHGARLLCHKNTLTQEAVHALGPCLARADLSASFLLVASLEDEANVHLALYARDAPERAPPTPAVSRVADAIQDAIRSLGPEADVAEHGGDLLPHPFAPKASAEERPPSVFQVTFRP